MYELNITSIIKTVFECELYLFKMIENSNVINHDLELKPVHSDMGILSRSDGSAIFCQGISV